MHDWWSPSLHHSIDWTLLSTWVVPSSTWKFAENNLSPIRIVSNCSSWMTDAIVSHSKANNINDFKSPFCLCWITDNASCVHELSPLFSSMINLVHSGWSEIRSCIYMMYLKRPIFQWFVSYFFLFFSSLLECIPWMACHQNLTHSVIVDA